MPRLVGTLSIITGEYVVSEEPDFEIAGAVFSAEPISDRQFFQQLAIDGYVSQSEAIAAVATGTMPAAVEAIISAMPSDLDFVQNRS